MSDHICFSTEEQNDVCTASTDIILLRTEHEDQMILDVETLWPLIFAEPHDDKLSGWRTLGSDLVWRIFLFPAAQNRAARTVETLPLWEVCWLNMNHETHLNTARSMTANMCGPHNGDIIYL